MARMSPTIVIPGIQLKLPMVLLLLLSHTMQAQSGSGVAIKIGLTQSEKTLKPTSTTSYTYPHLLEARVSPTNYKSAVKKGRDMWTMIRNPLKTGQSGWTMADVSKWGWKIKSDQNPEVFKDKTSGLEAALAMLQVSPGTSMNIRLEHSRDVSVNNIKYPATNAEYMAVYSPSKGTLIASDRHSPSYRKSTSSHLTNSPLPQLQYWSDLTFLSWHILTSANSEQQVPLRYIFVRGITNRATQQLILEALVVDGYRHQEVLPWPNFWMFTPNGPDGKVSEAFLAVLGTENFAGIAPLLAQHQETFGRKAIASVRVWGDVGKSTVLHGMVEVQ